MRRYNLIILSIIILSLFSCKKTIRVDEDICEALVTIMAWDDTSKPFNVKVFSNLQDYLNKENPIDEYENVKSGTVIKVKTRRNARIYFDVNSDDFRSTNWAQYHSFYVNVPANVTSEWITIATNASYRRMLLPNNTTQSKWIMVGYLDKYGNDILHTIPAYMQYRSLIINRNQNATYRYLVSPGDTVSEEYLFTVNNEHWAGINNSFSMAFYDTSMLDAIGNNVKDPDGQMYFAEGPVSQKHPYYAGFFNPPTPPILLPETDSLFFINSVLDSARMIFKRR